MIFDHSWVFWLYVPLGVLVLVMWRAYRWRVTATKSLGAVRGVKPVSIRGSILLLVGLGSLIFAASGPRWGKGNEVGAVVGRDLVIVFDFSWSMTAEDINDTQHRERWQAAREGILQLVKRVKERGGERLALVVFGARPFVVCPLTADYMHFENRLLEYTPHAPPPEIRPGPTDDIDSGTRLGWGIGSALELFNKDGIGYQDILLISDGDGPGVEADAEPAIRACLELEVPCHVCGIGNPKSPTPLTIGRGEDLEFVTTKLQEDFLRSVARRTKGEYIGANQDIPALNTFYDDTLRDRKKRDLPVDSVPLPQSRGVWFTLLGLVLVFFVWWRS